MAELILARSEVLALPGEAYRGVRQRFYALVLELCAQPVIASLLASQFSNFYRSLHDGERVELTVLQDADRLSINLQLEHEDPERVHGLVLGQRMLLGSTTLLPTTKWQSSIAIRISSPCVFSQQRCQEILDLRSSEELSYEVTSTTAVLSRVREELNIAAEIQRSFLISDQELACLSDRLDLAAMMQPSKEIGGDLYDCISLGSDRYLLCVGDVSGKGVPAALTMSTCLTLVRSYSEVIDSPSAIMRRVNQRMSHNNANCAFTTLFLGVLNARSGELRYCNAGHNPSLVLRKNSSIERLSKVHGPAVGVVENISYVDDRLNLSAGECLVIYTDGASEMFNPNHERFGLSGIESSIGAIHADSSSELVQGLMRSLTDFAAGEYPHDDITLLVARLRSASDPTANQRPALSISMPNSVSGLSLVKEQLNDFAALHQFKKPVLRKVQVVMDELLGNIIRYSCSQLPDDVLVDIRFEVTDGLLIAEIQDPGPEFNPLDSAKPDLHQPLEERPIGGLGLHLVKQMTRDMIYQRNGGKNQLRLTFSL